jgi:uncharacterized protein involved in oxidation of intracellular sulfur
MGDAVTCALKGQTTPNGYYNIEHMIKAVIARGGRFRVCGSWSDARGIKEDILTAGADRSTMEELTDWTIEADRVLVF